MSLTATISIWGWLISLLKSNLPILPIPLMAIFISIIGFRFVSFLVSSLKIHAGSRGTNNFHNAFSGSQALL
jgi:hypothetical protein